MRPWIILVAMAAASAAAQAQPVRGAASAPGPSFDCTAAMTAVEDMICTDDRLRAMDLGLDRFYASARRGREARRVTREQRQWLARRNACANRACLYEALTDRLWDLSESVGRDLPAYENDSDAGTLVIVPLGGEWYAFGVLGIREGPPVSSAAAGGAFRLLRGSGHVPRGNPMECDHSLVRLSGDRWQIVGHPNAERPSCGAFNISIEGTYIRRR